MTPTIWRYTLWSRHPDWTAGRWELEAIHRLGRLVDFRNIILTSRPGSETLILPPDEEPLMTPQLCHRSPS